MTLEYYRTPERIINRPCDGDRDWMRVRDLIIDTVPITPTGLNWEIRRWDGSRYHQEDFSISQKMAARIHLWETEDGKLVAAANPEGEGDVYLQIHPDYRALEAEMFAWGEANLKTTNAEGEFQIETFVLAYDVQRQRLLEERGYRRMDWGGMIRRIRFGGWTPPDPRLDARYRLRTVEAGNPGDCQRIADVLNASFNRTLHTAREYVTFSLNALAYRDGFDLVAEAADGTFAAFVGVYFDKANRRGIFEPVCTHPDHQRRGLARSLMFEGLHRLRAMGAADVLVDTGDRVPANALYDAVGFTEAYRGFIWQKRWNPE